MKKAILIGILIVCCGIAGYTFYEAWRLQDPEYQRQSTVVRTGMLTPPPGEREVVNLDAFVTEKQVAKEGTREIIPPAGIRFTAAIKQVPDRIEAEYVYTALQLMKVDPLPAVNHRMFVETSEGKIIPVYVWDEAVSIMNGKGVTGDQIELAGFHVYTYSKGPAIIVDALI
ncbi:MAG: hypothetical protein AAF479_02435 [Pseudomonadota bacterium]